MFPADDVLIARGKYSTLRSERETQLKRAQAIYASIVSAAHAALRDCEQTPPENEAHVQMIEKCLGNMKDTRTKLLDLGKQLVELKPLAWPKTDSQLEA